MDRGLIDFMISTGANLYHDLHYALNFTLHRGPPFLDDVELYEQGIHPDLRRPLPGDGAARNGQVHQGLPRALEPERPDVHEEYSVVARAAASGVPIYTSSPGDSPSG